jgi:hypothetical protein
MKFLFVLCFKTLKISPSFKLLLKLFLLLLKTLRQSPVQRNSDYPPATESLEWQNCGDFWFESNQEESDWMLEKVQYLYGVTMTELS